DAVGLLHPRQRGGVLLEHGLAVGDALLVHQAGEVVPDRRAELGLVVEQRQHRGVGRDRAHVRIEGGLANAGGARVAGEPVHAARIGGGVVWGWFRGRRGGGRAQERGRGQEQDWGLETHARHRRGAGVKQSWRV